MQKLRVGVLMGGKSIEREVSFNSGRTICDHLDTQRYAIIPLFQTICNRLFILPWHFLHRGKISDFKQRLFSQAQEITWDDLKNHIDFAYIAMHGKYAEDGTMQGICEVFGIPYIGSKVLGSALSMDKIMQKKFLHANNIATARDIVVLPDQITQFALHEQEIIQQIQQKGFGFPCIVKPYKEGSSLGVSVAHTKDELQQALINACFIDKKNPQSVLIEEKIIGMEFTCITITDYKTHTVIALPPTELVADASVEFFDYEQKYMPGRATEFTPARCSTQILEKIKDTCIQVMRALNLTNMSRIDGFVRQDGTIVIIDPNSFSGAAPSSFLFREAAFYGMSHTQLINHLIETELESYGMLQSIIDQEQKEATIMHTKKIRVGILMGGPSNEREISLESGRNVTYKLSPHKYEALPIFVAKNMELFTLSQQQLVLNSTQEIAQSLDTSNKIAWHDLSRHVDFVFIALHGGPGENGAVQGTLEMLGIPYNGSSVLASALCMDKFKTNQFLQSQGFEVPRNMLLDKPTWLNHKQDAISRILDQLPLPLIIKPHDDGCSVMVQKIKKSADLESAIDLIFSHGKEYALIEECITGMELTVGVIGNDSPRALPPSQAVCNDDILSIEEKFLPGAGENQTPAPLPKDSLFFVQKIMEAVYAAVGCKGYARIDCFYQSPDQSPTEKERVIILEINTLPGMTPATCIFHQAAEVNIKPMDFIDLIVTLGLEQHRSCAEPQQPLQQPSAFV
jgi:D-alanine-D-alanine ligase